MAEWRFTRGRIEENADRSPGSNASVCSLLQFQFMLIELHFASTLVAPDCQYPALVAAFTFMQNVFMFIMFYDFYRRAYGKQKNNA